MNVWWIMAHVIITVWILGTATTVSVNLATRLLTFPTPVEVSKQM